MVRPNVQMETSDTPDVPAVFRQCTNCLQHIPTANFALHEAHCRRRFCLCASCGCKLPLELVAEHRQQEVGDWQELVDALTRHDFGRVRRALAHSDGEIAQWRGPHGQTFLQVVLERGSGERSASLALVRELLSYGCDARGSDDNGVTVLHTAAQLGESGAVALLLEARADLHARTHSHAAPLSVASGEDTRLALIQAGARLSASESLPLPVTSRPLSTVVEMPAPPARTSSSKSVERLRARIRDSHIE